MIDCRPFGDTRNAITLRSHVGFHPRTLRNVMDADEYGLIYRDMCDKFDRNHGGPQHVCQHVQEWEASTGCPR